MQNQKKVCFFFVNTTDIQEFTGLIIESAKAGMSVTIMIFDIVTKKRNFYYYSLSDFENHFNELFLKNGIKEKCQIKKYGVEDRSKFSKDYDLINPDLVFTRNLYKLKYTVWHPEIDASKTAVYIWEHPETMMDYSASLIALARYDSGNIGFRTNKTIYVPTGRVGYIGTDHVENVCEELIDFCKNKKTCFIPETWARGAEDKSNNLPLILDVVKSLKSMGYSIVWKMREKGYPSQVDYSLNYVKEIEPYVDLVTKRDLNYPSNLYYLMKNCDMTCIFNVTSTALDSAHLSKNPFVFLSKHLSPKYRSKLEVGNHLSWGPFYENLDSNVNLYDEKYNDTPIKEFLLSREDTKRKQLKTEGSEGVHRRLVDKLLKKIS
jgi:hypothetical protein|tara:strand:- start:2200 stop:3330 length:1131 start_codon:yes stop_codon:yes gene_type:complete